MAPRSKKKTKGAFGNPLNRGKHIPRVPVVEPVVVQDDIEKLSFADFLKCMVNNNVTVLRISGEPTMHELFMAWITILSEYFVLIDSKEQLKYLKMAGKMEALNLKIVVVKALCESLGAWYDDRLIKCLQSWGFKLTYSEETLLADIAMTLTLLSNDEFKLLKMRLDYDKDQESKKRKKEAPTKNSYMKVLYAIEKFRQQRYSPDKITVYEFGMFQNELVEHNEALAAQQREISEDKYRKKK